MPKVNVTGPTAMQDLAFLPRRWQKPVITAPTHGEWPGGVSLDKYWDERATKAVTNLSTGSTYSALNSKLTKPIYQSTVVSKKT